nr:MAG TPA: hypothetical protein [Bacteriophage sp.]
MSLCLVGNRRKTSILSICNCIYCILQSVCLLACC